MCYINSSRLKQRRRGGGVRAGEGAPSKAHTAAGGVESWQGWAVGPPDASRGLFYARLRRWKQRIGRGSPKARNTLRSSREVKRLIGACFRPPGADGRASQPDSRFGRGLCGRRILGVQRDWSVDVGLALMWLAYGHADGPFVWSAAQEGRASFLGVRCKSVVQAELFDIKMAVASWLLSDGDGRGLADILELLKSRPFSKFDLILGVASYT